MNEADMQKHKLNEVSRSHRCIYNDNPMDTAVATPNKFANPAQMRKKRTEKVMVIKAHDAADTFIIVNCHIPAKWQNPKI